MIPSCPDLTYIGKEGADMIGIIGGTSLLYADLPELEKKVIHTPYGNSEVFCGDFAFLLRQIVSSHYGDLGIIFLRLGHASP